MRERTKLFPMLLLTLVVGCGPSSEDPAQTTRAVAAPVADLPAANAVAPTPVAAIAPPVRPAPRVTVRAQPAPLHPLDLPPSADAPQPDPFPQEVTSFMVDRDGCDHFRGEEPYDAERRAYLEESIAELCTGTDAKLATLRRRYDSEPEVIAALSGYESRIEATPPR
ncbi:MAG: hypothetical protein PSY12_05285 [bacterium]|nr:hypothetical protein [bacterium]